VREITCFVINLKFYRDISHLNLEQYSNTTFSERNIAQNSHGIFISVINQLDVQKFISCLYMFRAHVLETCRGMK